MSDATIDFHSNPRLVPDDVTLRFGTGNDTRLCWSTADAGNHSLVLALGDANQALHVTDAGAVATDWNVAADTHPALYLHSNTTPATDYLKIGGHDGTSATIDLVGGTTLKIAFDGSAEIDISATALSPSIDGGNALGTTSLGWNGLHLNTGTAISWENGDVTLTHAAGKLTLGGDGAVEFDFANHEMTNVDIDSGAIDGTVIGAASAAAGTFAALVSTSLSVSDGNITNVGDIALDSISADATNINFAITGFLGINETVNGNMTLGLTINQGANDNEALAFKSSDVAHPMTGVAETDTYGAIQKADALAGGLMIRGFRDPDGVAGQALHLGGILGEAADTTKTTSGTAVITLGMQVTDGGTSAQAVGADGNLLAIVNHASARFIFDAEGSAHADVEWTTFDEYDDLAVIAGFEAVMLNQIPAEQRLMYEETGIVGRNSWHIERGKLRAMVNTNKLSMLHHGALMQVGARLRAIEEKVGI